MIKVRTHGRCSRRSTTAGGGRHPAASTATNGDGSCSCSTVTTSATACPSCSTWSMPTDTCRPRADRIERCSVCTTSPRSSTTHRAPPRRTPHCGRCCSIWTCAERSRAAGFRWTTRCRCCSPTGARSPRHQWPTDCGCGRSTCARCSPRADMPLTSMRDCTCATSCSVTRTSSAGRSGRSRAANRTDGPADVDLDVAALGAISLGGTRLAQLVRAASGALRRPRPRTPGSIAPSSPMKSPQYGTGF